MQQAIDEFLGKLQADGRSLNTLNAYRTDLHELCRFVQGISPPLVDWLDVTDCHWAGYLAHLQRLGRSPATIARKSVVMGRFFAFSGLRLSKPAMSAATSATPSQEIQRRSAVDLAQISLLLAQAARSTASAARRDRALLALLWETGALASELACLNMGDFDPTSQTLVLDRGGFHERTLVLPEAAVTALTDYLAHGLPAPDSRQLDDPLLRNRKGGRLTRQGIWLIVRTLAQAAGIQSPVTPRRLRQAAAIRLLDAGTNRQAVQTRLGVANPPDSATDEEIPPLLLDGVAPTFHHPHALDND